MTIHIQTWLGSGSARVTDMTHAGKRGKRCRVLRFSGSPPTWDRSPQANDAQQKAARETLQVMAMLRDCDPSADFDEVARAVETLIAQVRTPDMPEYLLAAHREEVRGIDAPRPKLTAGAEGAWSAGADESGISLHDLCDPNQWTEITHHQTSAAAYTIATKVWLQVQTAKTLHEASSILRAAGARLHGYCAMD